MNNLLTQKLNVNVTNLLTSAFMVGFIGDLLLQLLTKGLGLGGSSGFGLISYFNQHGVAESMFIAGGMLVFFNILYINLIKLPLTVFNLALYGVILDLIFRLTMLFPSLHGYYQHLNYFWSAFWGAIPMILPLILTQVLEK
jgi:hypothetical protein